MIENMVVMSFTMVIFKISFSSQNFFFALSIIILVWLINWLIDFNVIIILELIIYSSSITRSTSVVLMIEEIIFMNITATMTMTMRWSILLLIEATATILRELLLI